MAVRRDDVLRAFATCGTVRRDMEQDVRRYGRRGRRCRHRGRERARRVPAFDERPARRTRRCTGRLPVRDRTGCGDAPKRATPRGMVRRRIAWSHRFWGCGVFASKLAKMPSCPSPPQPTTKAIRSAVRLIASTLVRPWLGERIPPPARAMHCCIAARQGNPPAKPALASSNSSCDARGVTRRLGDARLRRLTPTAQPRRPR